MINNSVGQQVSILHMHTSYEIVSRLANSGFCNKKYRSGVQRKETPI